MLQGRVKLIFGLPSGNASERLLFSSGAVMILKTNSPTPFLINSPNLYKVPLVQINISAQIEKSQQTKSILGEILQGLRNLFVLLVQNHEQSNPPTPPPPPP